ncbi:MbtH family NRPS accessory protein [Streptomyces olivochromogenes]|nr:MbtH family NRPS accessory protein [Streptomyces olivochromogenes]
MLDDENGRFVVLVNHEDQLTTVLEGHASEAFPEGNLS